MKVLVTGANGLVGNATCATLKNRGFNVLGGLRSLSVGGPKVDTVIISSVDEHTNWTSSLLGIGAVVHLAARVHVMHDRSSDPLVEFRRVNVQGTLNLARQSAAAGVRRFVFISSVKVNGESTQAGCAFTEADLPNPQDAYGHSKHEAEQGLRQIATDTGMEVVIIRPPLVYGPGVKANFAALMRAVQRGWPLPLGAVHNQRSLVALDNLVDFIVTCLAHSEAANQTFLISDGHDLSTPELVRDMAQAAGVSARLLLVPMWALRAGAAMLGKRHAMQRLCGNLQVDISKARTLLGWVPPISVAQGLHLAMTGKALQPLTDNTDKPMRTAKTLR